MATESVAKALRLVQLAKQKKVESVVVGLQDEINDGRAEIKMAKSKLQSINSELSKLRSEKSECERNLADLNGLQEHLSKEEYEEALQSLSGAINDYEKKIEKSHFDLDKINEEMSRLESRVGMLSDKQKSLRTDSDGMTPIRASEELMVAACREELQDLYHACLNLKPYVVQVRSEDPWQSSIRPDSEWSRAMIRVHCMVLVGKLKSLAESCELNEQEQVIMRRNLGRIGTITKETLCGSVESLKMSAKENWAKYVQLAQAEQSRLEAKAAQEKARLMKKAEPRKESDESNSEHEKTVEFVVSSGLLTRTKDSTIGIIGGEPGRNEEARRWLEDALQAEQVVWYEDKDADKMARSISTGGMSAAVIMANWIGHKYSDVVVKAAKKGNIPLAMCNQSNRRMLIQELASAMGVREEVRR